jgi:hypothetical protein
MLAFPALLALLAALGLTVPYATPAPTATHACPADGCPLYESEAAAETDDSLAMLPPDAASARPLSMLPAPMLAQIATRGNVAEPARSTTCYLDLDCPE